MKSFTFRSLVSSIKIDSYFSPDFVPLLRMSMSILSTKVCTHLIITPNNLFTFTIIRTLLKVNFLHDVQETTSLARYNRVSEPLEKYEIVLIQLDEIHSNLIVSQKSKFQST